MLGSLADKITQPISINVSCNIDGVVLFMRQSLKHDDVVAYWFNGCIDGLSECM